MAKARNNVASRLRLNLPEFTALDVQKTMGLPVDKVYELSFSKVAKSEFEVIRKHLDAEIAAIVANEGATLFPNVEKALRFLSEKVPLFLVSNCSERYLATYFEWSGHRTLFKDSICYGENRLPKSANINIISSRNNLQKPVYIGDTNGDHQAALTAGVPYIHADYGFGKPDGPCSKISDISQLMALFK